MTRARGELRRHWLHGRARITPALVAVYLTGSALLAGLASFAAALPRSESITFHLPDGNGNVTARFYPTLQWGWYSIVVRFPDRNLCTPLPDCSEVGAGVYTCADTDCSAPGYLLTGGGDAPVLVRDTNLNEFYIHVYGYPRTLEVVVSSDFNGTPFPAGSIGSSGLFVGSPSGGSTLLVITSWVALGGLAAFGFALGAWRYERRPLVPPPRF
ncbi:MAG: hypothetical protein ACLQD8_09215 [Thermoplasmata archaeon]